MTAPTPPRLAGWLLATFLPESERETIPGDLAEEFAVLAADESPARARRWYWRQTSASLWPLFRTNARRGGWLKAIGAALAAYIVVAAVVIAGDMLSARLLHTGGGRAFAIVSLVIAVPAMTLGGYLAAWMWPPGAKALAALVTVMGFLSLAVTGDGAPAWYQVTLIAIGFSGSLLGGRIRRPVRKEKA